MTNEHKSMMFIDYEYSFFNYIQFDIANHFVEWTSIYTEENYYLDYNEYPNYDEKELFCLEYITQSDIIAGIKSNQTSFKKRFDKLKSDIDLFIPCALLFWGIWGVIQQNDHKNIKKFDYLGFSKKRLTEFTRLKQK